MPFTATLNGELVTPHEVGNEYVQCLDCGDFMHTVSSHTRADGAWIPRHFAHNPGSVGGDSCAEGDVHLAMKASAKKHLDRMVEHGQTHVERQIDGTNRRADVVVEFSEKVDRHGEGIVVEVQDKHEDKDMPSVIREYLRAGYSVYWLERKHFTDDFTDINWPDMIPVWPNGVPTVGEWSGPGIGQYTPLGTPPTVEIKMTPDYFAEHESELKAAWTLGSGKYSFDVVRRLDASNASRSCSECGDAARCYLFQDGVISTFRCFNHLPDNLTSEVVDTVQDQKETQNVVVRFGNGVFHASKKGAFTQCGLDLNPHHVVLMEKCKAITFGWSECRDCFGET